jgi:RNA polymerase sigma-70 factor (ECF subfamily)
MAEAARVRPALRLVQSERDVPAAPPAKPALDDAEILTALRRGDAAAAVALHDRVRPTIDRTIVRLLGRRGHQHEDLAQVSMIALVGSLERFRGDCSLDTWTARITAHTVFKDLRRRKLERTIFDLDAEPEVPCRRGPLDEASDRSTLARIRRHLEAMDPAKAWTLVLHDVEGYDLREIAEITEVSVAAAQTRLVRGRRELHERLQGDPELADLLSNRGSRA